MISKYKKEIYKTLAGFENSLKVKGLLKLLSDIDSNSVSADDVDRLLSVYSNKVILRTKRTNKLKQLEFWQDNIAYVKTMLHIYIKLNSAIYNVDKNFLNWYRGSSVNKLLYQKLNDVDNPNILSFLENMEHILVTYNGVLYSIVGNEPNDSVPTTHIEIQTIGNFTGITFDYIFEDGVENSKEMYRSLSVICNCKSCPRYKQSLSRTYADEGREVYCSHADCNKCEGFKDAGLLTPKDCEDLYEALFLCINSREYTNKDRINDKEYEHIPKPMRTDDVVIYFGEKKSGVDVLKDKFKVTFDDSPIVDSHASPREHYRRGGTRRAYTRKDGVKVRATTFKATTVNKGHDKCSYSLRQRKA